jgi:molybdenum cofactor cytidylyltransferase
VTATAVVLAAGGSRRLGRPKQLLPYRDGTLLDATLELARRVRREGLVDQVVVALGGAAAEVEAVVDLTGMDVVHNPGFGSGCSSSIAAAVPNVDDASEGIVLLLGDQPGVSVESVAALVGAVRHGPDARLERLERLAVCRYDDGPGHPFWLGRELFPELLALHGDKAVWRLIEEEGDRLVSVHVEGPVPRDVDTLEDYRLLVQSEDRP